MTKTLLAAFIPLVALVASTASSTTWYVDASVTLSGNGTSWQTAFKTIQEGLHAAAHGNTVIVAQGIYVENIHFNGRNVTLRSTDPLQSTVVQNTIIDGGGGGNSAVSFVGTEDKTCLLAGFTIQNGTDADFGGAIGGGPPHSHTQATIQNNNITANSAYVGGAIANCDGIIQNNNITANAAWLYGGALADCHGEIRNNTISGNTAQDSGGGLYDCDGLIENNIISANSGGLIGGGLKFCDGTILNNSIAGNQASDYGGGLYHCRGTIRGNTIATNAVGWQGGALSYCSAAIENNRIIENRATAGAGLDGCDGVIENNLIAGNVATTVGGAVKFCDGAIRNNTVVANSAGTVGGGFYSCDGTILNCIVWGNVADLSADQIYTSTTPSFSCIQDWPGGGQGNTSQSPAFLDPDGPDDDPLTHQDNDYRLSHNSSCIDQGLNQDWMWQAVDLEGNPRLFLGQSSLTVDMGTYEYGSFSFQVVYLAAAAGNHAQLTWSSRPGDTYVVWSRADLSSGAWMEEAWVFSQGQSSSWTDIIPLPRAKFYRIGVE